MITALSSVTGVSQLGSVAKTLFETNDTASAGQVTPGAANGQSFGEVLGNMAVEAINNVKLGEAKSFEGIQGKASTREVVDAVMQAEQSLQTAIAFRDKLVSAFLDITKMQI
jgi:flagellar hook-basal body complex protein FliE